VACQHGQRNRNNDLQRATPRVLASQEKMNPKTDTTPQISFAALAFAEPKKNEQKN
jgi:hypothetical protein